MSTRKLYYEDSHLREFTARVVSCEKTDKGFEIVLDETAFYPEGGGQGADTGSLSGVRVLDTRERSGEIVHLCDGFLEPGQQVQGRVDWEARFQRMQQHSGEHIVSGILHRRYGVSNTGFHMGKERTVIDFDGIIPPEALTEIEQEANGAVQRNLSVKCWYPAEAELPGVAYRSKKALSWPVRIVEFPGFDCCACCGTHVKQTGEIGIIKLFSAVPFRGGTRIEMACGNLALKYLNQVLSSATQAGRLFSVPPEQVGTAAESFQQQLSNQKYRIIELQRRLFASIAKDCENKGDVLLFEENLDSTGLRELCDAVADKCQGRAAVFSGSDDTGYGYCLALRDGDLRQFGKDMNAKLNGRGGGKPSFLQGSVKARKAEIEAFFESNSR